MSIYMRFEDNRQVETTVVENRPDGWYEAPEDFSWQKSYCLTDGGEIAERTQENIQEELLDNAKLCAFDSIRFYFDNYTYKHSGLSHQKAKSYAIQAKAAEKMLIAEEIKQQLDDKDVEIIEPLAKVRGITIIEMAKLIHGKAQKAVKAIAKCEELEDIAKERIKKAKDEAELQDVLEHCKREMQKVIVD